MSVKATIPVATRISKRLFVPSLPSPLPASIVASLAVRIQPTFQLQNDLIISFDIRNSDLEKYSNFLVNIKPFINIGFVTAFK